MVKSLSKNLLASTAVFGVTMVVSTAAMAAEPRNLLKPQILTAEAWKGGANAVEPINNKYLKYLMGAENTQLYRCNAEGVSIEKKLLKLPVL